MSLLAALRDSTADCHHTLEASMDVLHRVQSMDDYRRLLLAFLSVYQPMERALAAAVDWPRVAWDFEARRKTPLILADLDALGLATDHSPPRELETPPITGLAEAVGMIYVLEGSTLGGQLISRHFSQRLGLTPVTGGKFFHGYGAETGARWREFGQWAESAAWSHPEEFKSAAIQGARTAFDVFSRGLTP